MHTHTHLHILGEQGIQVLPFVLRDHSLPPHMHGYVFVCVGVKLVYLSVMLCLKCVPDLFLGVAR